MAKNSFFGTLKVGFAVAVTELIVGILIAIMYFILGMLLGANLIALVILVLVAIVAQLWLIGKLLFPVLKFFGVK